MYLYLNISEDHIHSTVFQENQFSFDFIRRSHIVGEVISCTTRKNNRSIIHNYEPDFSSQSTA